MVLSAIPLGFVRSAHPTNRVCASQDFQHSVAMSAKLALDVGKLINSLIFFFTIMIYEAENN
jgi:hypothetical protein